MDSDLGHKKAGPSATIVIAEGPAFFFMLTLCLSRDANVFSTKNTLLFAIGNVFFFLIQEKEQENLIFFHTFAIFRVSSSYIQIEDLEKW